MTHVEAPISHTSWATAFSSLIYPLLLKTLLVTLSLFSLYRSRINEDFFDLRQIEQPNRHIRFLKFLRHINGTFAFRVIR